MRVIAIDGPAGSGKSTVARAVAERLGLDYLDTGAMYRSVALAVVRQGVDPADVDVVARIAVDVEIDNSAAIRTPEVNGTVSVVAANPGVRREMVRRQREWIAQHGGGVVEGRDIGTVVAPDAALKVFLTASEEERARRRSEEADPGARDRIDSTRSVSPLKVADDALVIDTTGRSVDDIVEEVLSKLRPERSDGVRPTARAQARPAAMGVGRSPTGSIVKPDLLFYRMVRGIVVAFSRLFWRLRVEGQEHVPRRGAFVLAPVHRSNIDTLVVAAVTSRRMRYMGKDSLWKIGLAGKVFSALGAFPVHRGTADREALRRCIEVIEGGEPLVIFPEGTRQSGPAVQPLFEGAAYVATRTGVPIVPVGIGGSEAAMPKGSKLLRPVPVRVVVGEPLYPPPPGPSGRVPRSAVHTLTEELAQRLQKLFDLSST